MPFQQKSKNSAHAHVTVYTWGTTPDAKTGLQEHLRRKSEGGNVGHAAVEVTFPANTYGQSLIQQYCKQGAETIIPHSKETVMVEPKTGKTQDFYKVYFSGWPQPDPEPGDPPREGVSLNTFIADTTSERSGHQFGSGGNTNQLGMTFEQRRDRGSRKATDFTLGPETITHQRYPKGSDEDKYIKAYSDLVRQNNKVDTLKKLEDKLVEAGITAAKDGPIDINKESRINTKRMLDAHIPEWRTTVGNETLLQPVHTEALHERVTKEIEKNEDIQEKMSDKVASLQQKLNTAYQPDPAPVIDQLKKDLAGKSLSEQETLLKQCEQQNPYAYYSYQIEALGKKEMLLFKLKDAHVNPMTMMKSPKEMFFPSDPNGKSEFPNWQSVLGLKEDTYTKDKFGYEQLTEISKLADEALKKVETEATELYTKRQEHQQQHPLLSQLANQALTIGQLPDQTVSLPIAMAQSDQKTSPGLTVEPMLAKMREIADRKNGFDLKLYNCSQMATEVLTAGAKSDHKHLLERKDHGGFHTPQQVHYNASKYQSVVVGQKGKLSLGQQLERMSPAKQIRNALGKFTRTLADRNKTTGDKVLAASLAVPTAIVGAPIIATAKLSSVVADIPDAIKSKITAKEHKYKDPTQDGSKNIQTIDMPNDPQAAINQFIQKVNQSNENIPTFSPQTMKAASIYMNSLDLKQPENTQLMENYQKAAALVMQRSAEVIDDNRYKPPVGLDNDEDENEDDVLSDDLGSEVSEDELEDEFEDENNNELDDPDVKEDDLNYSQASDDESEEEEVNIKVEANNKPIKNEEEEKGIDLNNLNQYSAKELHQFKEDFDKLFDMAIGFNMDSPECKELIRKYFPKDAKAFEEDPDFYGIEMQLKIIDSQTLVNNASNAKPFKPEPASPENEAKAPEPEPTSPKNEAKLSEPEPVVSPENEAKAPEPEPASPENEAKLSEPERASPENNVKSPKPEPTPAEVNSNKSVMADRALAENKAQPSPAHLSAKATMNVPKDELKTPAKDSTANIQINKSSSSDKISSTAEKANSTPVESKVSSLIKFFEQQGDSAKTSDSAAVLSNRSNSLTTSFANSQQRSRERVEENKPVEENTNRSRNRLS